MIEEIQKITPWLNGLPVLPKIILSLVIISVAAFILTLIWNKTPNADERTKSTNLVAKGTIHQFKIEIKSPPDNSKVPERPTVEGTIIDPSANISVVVHPMETSDYWVQPDVSIKKDGNWKVKIYIGRPGNLDIGKQFEIMAVGNPYSKLKEGDILSGWPDVEWKSPVIEVTRR